jgi:hypothetical protein
MREIVWSDEFAECVERLGGARAVDAALEPLIEALMRNPYGFDKIENDWVSCRYAKTKAIQDVLPPLLIMFTIGDDKNVTLQWVEEYLPF